MKIFSLFLNMLILKFNMSSSRKRIEKIQKRKLIRLLKYAYRHSPYYRESFEGQGIREDQIDKLPLSDFPSIDKKIFMERFDDLITVPGITQEELRLFDENPDLNNKAYLDKYHIIHSSGSTGSPKYFVYDESAWKRMIPGIIRGAVWDLSIWQLMKLLAGGIRILYIAAVNGRYGGAMAVGAGVDGLNGKRLFLDVNTPLAEWTEKITEFCPNIIIGYPSALKILAEISEKKDVFSDICRVISCGEPLTPGMRMHFEKVFQSVVINFYGASESLAIGVETAAEDGMYLFDDLNYIEVLDNAIYLTSLYNFIQPLIRYRISDKLLLKPDSNSKKMAFTKVHVLQGRDEDVMWFENDNGHRDFIHPLSVEGFCLDGLIDYQFCQTGKDSFEMMAEVPQEDIRVEIDWILNKMLDSILEEKGLEYVNFKVIFTGKILPDSKTGKKPLIVDKENYRSYI